MNHPLALGHLVRFLPNAEALDQLRYDAAVIEGQVISVDATSTGHWRYRLRNDDRAPGCPTVERIVYSHEGHFEPVDPVTDLSAIARFERLRAAGQHEESIHNAIDALRIVAGRAGESNLDVWDRWGCYIGATEIAHRTGDQVARWMASNLLRQPWIDSALPRAGVPSPAQVGVVGVQRAIEQHERAAAEMDRFRAKEEARLWDVETMIPDAPEVAVARAALTTMVAQTARHRAELSEDLGIASRAEAAERQKEIDEAACAWSRPDLRELRKRPSTSAISGWFSCAHADGVAWSDNAMVDLVSEPHLSRWQSQRSTLRTESVAAGLDRCLPTSEGIPVEPIAVHAALPRKGEAFVVLASRSSVTFVAAKYWRYFASKFGTIHLRLHPANPIKDTLSVWHDGRRVGVVMPLQRPPMTHEDVAAALERADALRAHEARANAA